MSFTRRDLRRGMDVFGADGVFLGTVVWVWQKSVPRSPSAAHGGGQAETRTAAASFSGESTGPMPTAAIGNGGPAQQRRTTGYGTAARTDVDPNRRPSELLIVRSLVALNWGTLRPLVRRIPVGLIQLVSLERIMLSVDAGEIEDRLLRR